MWKYNLRCWFCRGQKDSTLDWLCCLLLLGCWWFFWLETMHFMFMLRELFLQKRRSRCPRRSWRRRGWSKASLPQGSKYGRKTAERLQLCMSNSCCEVVPSFPLILDGIELSNWTLYRSSDQGVRMLFLRQFLSLKFTVCTWLSFLKQVVRTQNLERVALPNPFSCLQFGSRFQEY